MKYLISTVNSFFDDPLLYVHVIGTNSLEEEQAISQNFKYRSLYVRSFELTDLDFHKMKILMIRNDNVKLML